MEHNDASAFVNFTVPIPSALERSAVASVIAITSGVSLLSYFVLFATILYSKKLRSNPFYQVLFSLAINDALCQFSYLAIAAPSTYAGFDYLPTFDVIMNTIALQIAWFHNSLLLLFQSFNRLLFFCYPERYNRFFGGHRIWYFIGTSWLVGLAFGLPAFWPCCRFSFFVKEYAFDIFGGESGNQGMRYVEVCYTLTNLIIVLVVHAFLFYTVYRRGQAVQTEAIQFQQLRRNRERRLIAQLFVGTILLIVDEINSNIVPLATKSRFGGFFGSLVEIVAMASNGVVFLLFNETVNGEARTMLRISCRALSCRRGNVSPPTALALVNVDRMPRGENQRGAAAALPRITAS